MKRERCGPCIDADHDNVPAGHADCVVVVEMNVGKGRGRPRQRHAENKVPHNLIPYLWRCGCSCTYAQLTKCVDCGRVGVAVDRMSRCVDVEECQSLVGESVA